MRRYLIFAALVAAFLCSAGNSYAARLTEDRARSAAQAFTRFAAVEGRETGTVAKPRRCGPRCFHARVAWLAGTDEFEDTSTGEYYLDRIYERETVTIKLLHAHAWVWSPWFQAWHVRGFELIG